MMQSVVVDFLILWADPTCRFCRMSDHQRKLHEWDFSTGMNFEEGRLAGLPGLSFVRGVKKQQTKHPEQKYVRSSHRRQSGMQYYYGDEGFGLSPKSDPKINQLSDCAPARLIEEYHLQLHLQPCKYWTMAINRSLLLSIGSTVYMHYAQQKSSTSEMKNYTICNKIVWVLIFLVKVQCPRHISHFQWNQRCYDTVIGASVFD